ncbi:hypothetical protein OPT61_g10530 [Boeremia exigua]|uniref:Uncharacterized protein n=1 Tax=Boeremia exigua TaxID=749465 RepID=A0ACC2HPB1_9PLEO|nr:hypothetical protein OPT61_g10530 [Boeremia exigua]
MNRLKSKASQFFKHEPSQTEKPVASTNQDNGSTDGTGPSKFFRSKTDDPLPALPTDTKSSDKIWAPEYREHFGECESNASDTTIETNKPLPSRPVSPEAAPLPSPDSTKSPNPALKRRPSFATLRKSSTLKSLFAM